MSAQLTFKWFNSTSKALTDNGNATCLLELIHESPEEKGLSS